MLLVLLLLLCIIYNSNGFADWLASQYCDRPLIAGEIIMNHEVELNNDRKIIVYRNEIEIKSGDEYILGEKLTISITEVQKTTQFMFETSKNAKFDGGTCDGIRSAKAKPTLILPTTISNDSDNKVTIVSGWAYGHETVYITEPFILNPPGNENKEGTKIKDKDEIPITTIQGNVPTHHKIAAGISSKTLAAGDKSKGGRRIKKTQGSIPSNGKQAIHKGEDVHHDKDITHIPRLHDEEEAIKLNTLTKTRADINEGIGNEDMNEPKAAKEKLKQILSKAKSGISDHWKKIKKDIKSSTGIKNSELKKAAKKAKKEKRKSQKIRLRGGSNDHNNIVSFVEYGFVIAAISYVGYRIVKDRFKIFRYYLRLRGRNVDK